MYGPFLRLHMNVRRGGAWNAENEAMSTVVLCLLYIVHASRDENDMISYGVMGREYIIKGAEADGLP